MRIVSPAVVAVLSLLGATSPASAQEARSAIASMLGSTTQSRVLEARAGNWTVTIKIRPSANAEPIVYANLRAERQMIGGFLQEIIAPISPKPGQDFRRISYTHYNPVEGRWQYVSMDTRFPAGIMPAWSARPTTLDRLELEFAPIAFPGWGTEVEGWMLRSSYEVTGIGTAREIARQYWVRANGSGERWLAVEFDYRRSNTSN